MPEYFITERKWTGYNACWSSGTLATISPEQAALGALPPELVRTLQDATPEQLQEIADYAFICSKSCLTYLEWFSRSDTWTVMGLRDKHRGNTRAEALHALAEQVRAEVKP